MPPHRRARSPTTAQKSTGSPGTTRPGAFTDLLRRARLRRGLSQRALARASRINPAIVSRLESGDRGPSGPEQVRALATALALEPPEADALLASAGFWPQALLDLGPADETLLAVAQLLTSPRLTPPERARFRAVVGLLIDQWLSSPR
jgi:transcriptional regulator with XRE-family HTH domain